MKVIVIGATSGIGRAIAEKYVADGHSVGITGRRVEKLNEVKAVNPTAIFVSAMDVTDVEAARATLASLVSTMGGLDVLIINAGIGYPKATYEQQLETLDVNARGFMALANWGFEFFAQQKCGQLVGISSVAAVRSSPQAVEYHATKAFVSSYLEGLRYRTMKWYPDIHVTDIRPGFVATAMTEDNKQMFWVATPEKAARQITEAIAAKKSVAYITKRYVLIAWLLKILPDWAFVKMM